MPDFRGEERRVAAVESTLPVTATAVDARVAATAEIGQSIRRGMIALRIVDGIFRNVYEINIGKLALPVSPSLIPRLRRPIYLGSLPQQTA